jgi:hypothetical protein
MPSFDLKKMLKCDADINDKILWGFGIAVAYFF